MIIGPAGLLCTTVWITCAQQRRACVHRGEMLGIALRADTHNRVFTCEIVICVLCINKNLLFSTRHAEAINN